MRLHDAVSRRNSGYATIVEHCEGGTLFDYVIMNGKVGEQDCVVLFRELLLCVRAIHQCSCLHRNIKTEKIMFLAPDTFPEFRLGGFSRACRVEDATTSFMSVFCNQDVAPETSRMDGRKQGYYSDVWSLGVLFFVCIAGSNPFDIGDKIKIRESDMKTFKASKPKGVSTGGLEFVKSILHLDPSKRPTIDQILRHPWLAQHRLG
eukprot:CAMPEP_0185759682 /NCGR_PEP_ID=MMETSP1174-20130828/18444_1 /TAXON_ID=35687 /ORGANISM="Dictyocha speculum, Strain CCMP1381" /LENGTH=204 /DNA_ID=CAMNT_0028440131 /DNA_START=30 /DNA_END=640 /DNA_ORIENTATION=+